MRTRGNIAPPRVRIRALEAAPEPRHPARGYALVVAGATMFALNGSMARYLLDDGVDAVRLSQLRSAGSWLILLLAVGLSRPALLRVDARELPALALLG